MVTQEQKKKHRCYQDLIVSGYKGLAHSEQFATWVVTVSSYYSRYWSDLLQLPATMIRRLWYSRTSHDLKEKAQIMTIMYTYDNYNSFYFQL